MAEGVVMTKIITPPGGFQLGIQRFLELEQRVSDIEKTLEIMKELLHTNNESLQGILDAVERENAGKN